MRRSSTPLTAWPAFADLMTVLAVVSLAIAVGLGGGDSSPNGSGPKDPVTGHLDDGFMVPNHEIEKRAKPKGPGSPSCLNNPGRPPTPEPLLQIVALRGYVVTEAWSSEHEDEVDAIPQLADDIEHGRMDAEEFERYADALYQYGDRDDTFGGSCRFFVILEKGETEPEFGRAFGVVSKYFLILNSSRVLGYLAGE